MIAVADIDKLKPDWETDLLIAKSIGIECEWMGYDVLRHTDVGAAFFHPSRDIRAAFWAADRAGLFAKDIAPGFICLIWCEANEWEIAEIDPDAQNNIIKSISKSNTPAMAICKAILTLMAK